MIVRVLGQGQYRIDESDLERLNASDDRVQQALQAGDQQALTEALRSLIADVTRGQQVADDDLVDSDLIVPDESATLDEVQALLDSQGSTEGLIPG